jgi:thiol-disulfide isomerase/thioredoxin
MRSKGYAETDRIILHGRVTFRGGPANYSPVPEHDFQALRRILMLSRRSIVFATLVASTAAVMPAFAAALTTFDAGAFAEAQKAGKPILIAVHATWCPTCKAQAPILSELRAEPKFAGLIYFVIDFDGPRDLLKRFDVRTQSTLIAFKGTTEVGRSVGDTDKSSIRALVGKTL